MQVLVFLIAIMVQVILLLELLTVATQGALPLLPMQVLVLHHIKCLKVGENDYLPPTFKFKKWLKGMP